MLKAAVKEGDKNREVLARQMTHAMKQEMQLSSQHYSPRNGEDQRERQKSNERPQRMADSRSDL